MRFAEDPSSEGGAATEAEYKHSVALLVCVRQVSASFGKNPARVSPNWSPEHIECPANSVKGPTHWRYPLQFVARAYARVVKGALRVAARCSGI